MWSVASLHTAERSLRWEGSALAVGRAMPGTTRVEAQRADRREEHGQAHHVALSLCERRARHGGLQISSTRFVAALGHQYWPVSFLAATKCQAAAVMPADLGLIEAARGRARRLPRQPSAARRRYGELWKCGAAAAARTCPYSRLRAAMQPGCPACRVCPSAVPAEDTCR